MLSSASTGNKKELAKALGTSTITLDRWLERFGGEVPCIQHGTNGQAYVFDLAATVGFFQAKREEEAERQADRDEKLAQLALPFLDAAPASKGALSLKDQREALLLGKLKREEAERLGQLIPAAETREAIATGLARWNRSLHIVLRQIATDHNLPDPVMRALDARLAATQREFVRDLRSELLDESRAA